MADGTFRWHLSRALSVREDEGRIKWFGTTTDIHAVKAAPHTRNAVIVAVTGYGQARDRAATASAGFDAHFVKPVDSNALERFVGQCKR